MKSFTNLCNAFIIFPTLVFFNNHLYAQAPSIQWQKCLGGSNADECKSIIQTADGGYIVAGSTQSNDGNVSGNHGFTDAWVVKLNASGSIQWQKCLGGTDGDGAYSIQQTSDGGFIMAGATNSNDGDVSGNHGNGDCWVVKLDASGNIQWQKCLGGSGGEVATSIQQTTDGGYILAGLTDSNNGDVSGHHGSIDYWIVKLNTTGNIQWQKCLGGFVNDLAYSIQQTTDGGYVVAGYTFSQDGNVSGNHGEDDFWVVKLDAAGNIQWQKCLGGSAFDFAYAIQQTTDGGYIIAGGTNSSSGDVSGNHGGDDYWVVKLMASGSIQWQKCLGGTDYEFANSSIQQTTDGGYILAGCTLSNDGDVSGNHGTYDYWVVKLNSSGNLQWQKCLGGSAWDGYPGGDGIGSITRQTSDGGFIVAGVSGSNDGDISGNHGNDDYWVVKLTSTVAGVTPGIFSPANLDLQIHANPVHQNATITFYLGTSKRVSLVVFNIAGQQIGIIDDGVFTRGNQTIPWNTEKLAAGVYFIQFKTINFSIAKKVIVIH